MNAPSLRGADLSTIDTLIALAEHDVQRHKASAENVPNDRPQAKKHALTFTKLSAEARQICHWLQAARTMASAQIMARTTAAADG